MWRGCAHLQKWEGLVEDGLGRRRVENAEEGGLRADADVQPRARGHAWLCACARGHGDVGRRVEVQEHARGHRAERFQCNLDLRNEMAGRLECGGVYAWAR